MKKAARDCGGRCQRGCEFDLLDIRYRTLTSREKPHFPSADQVTRKFLLVDMLNNLAGLAEDTDAVLKTVQAKLGSSDAGRLQQASTDYASARTRRLLANGPDVDRQTTCWCVSHSK